MMETTSSSQSPFRTARATIADELRFRRSRAIYDCSAALYYGPPSFKVYYRRGYALAYLDMWDKAILSQFSDFALPFIH